MEPVTATDSYLSMLLYLPHLSANTVFSLLLLTFMRIIPIMALAPFFGGAKIVPTQIRIMFALSIVAIVLPQNLMHAHGELPFNMLFIAYAVKELFLGLAMGFLVSIPFYVAQTSGSLVDHMRGSASLQVTDPTTQSQAGVLGIMYNYITIVIFFLIGGPFIFLEGVVKSYKIIPVDQFFNPVLFSINYPLWKLIIGLLTYIMSMSIQLAAPALVGILMAEMFLGIANRLAPQVQIVFLGIPLKSWLGICLLFLAWYLIIQQLGKESIDWLNTMERTIHSITPLTPS